ncbi:MAG: response regulator [Planctomycetaceae bacterium]
MQRGTVGRVMEVLLVEDSLPAARLTMGALKRGGIEHRMTWIADGDEALQFLTQQEPFTRAPQPDLVLLDLMLPGKSGRELLHEIREGGELSDIPVVIMTGNPEEQATLHQEGLEVQGFIEKPVDLDAFLALIARLKDFWKADMILPEQAHASSSAAKVTSDDDLM